MAAEMTELAEEAGLRLLLRTGSDDSGDVITNKIQANQVGTVKRQ